MKTKKKIMRVGIRQNCEFLTIQKVFKTNLNITCPKTESGNNFYFNAGVSIRSGKFTDLEDLWDKTFRYFDFKI